jgi:hypothetical protein
MSQRASLWRLRAADKVSLGGPETPELGSSLRWELWPDTGTRKRWHACVPRVSSAERDRALQVRDLEAASVPGVSCVLRTSVPATAPNLSGHPTRVFSYGRTR